MARPVRIFQLAKELNISHTEIVSFLKNKGIVVGSHMSPVDDDAHALIMDEFAKDKENVDRYRKEQVRREIHDTRVKAEQLAHKKVVILSLEDQRALEKEEKEKAAEKAKQDQKKAKQKQAEEKAKKDKEKEKKKEAQAKPKRKLRRIDLSSIESQVGQKQRKPIEKPGDKKPHVAKTTDQKVKATMAKMQTKTKKKVYKKEKVSEEIESEQKRTNISIAEFSSVEDLGKIFNVSSSEIIQKCMALGVLATINQRLDWEVIELLAEEYDMVAEKISDIGEELYSFKESEEDLAHAIERAPVVTVMGHVDHGKTSLLDHIRDANVVAGESGGITQHIGAYKVELESGNHITFLDTPGHEAFTAMRARGAKVTDMVVLVVAANDGVMPQTIESIDHARAANVPLIIAINKTDLPDTDIDRIKRELSEHEVLVEDWGGKVQAVPISAKSGDGIEDLMNAVILESEVLELKANKDTLAKGTVIDSRLDKGHGAIATVLIQKGTLKIGDPFMCASYSGKVRALLNERGQRIQEAFPSDAIQVLGFDKVPQTADILSVVENERELKRISSERQRIKREIDQKKIGAQSLDAMSAMIKEGAIKNLPLIIKGDVDGSIEALSETLEKLSTDEVGIQIIHKAVGMISESDVLLAEASQAVIIGFNVQVSSNAKLQANQAGVEIRNYSIIYNAVEEIKLALEGLLEPDKIEEVVGRAEILTQFKIPKIGNIAGTKVVMGIINRGAKARVIHDDETIHEGNVTSLKRFKDDAKEVKEGLECGIGVDGVKTFNEGDIIEIFEIKTVKRTLG
ncbi:MAG: translation initiation factor IF-2 [Candidatus Marinimicrobia bacterium]|jgi:translation initiation factor IF-2|nr:translation initiation factor IF-2 [Candidatus Neomarinimicrobiota bacterium]MBT3618193.1 translation initiation factor IF-2 [Candidatus Neomarinimicrobiota bacterium]MBT3828664.1 translation initiation factor IF-2 [Candidatus Neomarinimicrobiota bacterium]MBT3996874.1 translation initiation factor IF-2 [Candidatus Neomarinimicrobiota bacterium]MBT4280838.1 translation initiation factor IF-2 [Candidatus Neomarinimicrobiota bacterium]